MADIFYRDPAAKAILDAYLTAHHNSKRVGESIQNLDRGQIANVEAQLKALKNERDKMLKEQTSFDAEKTFIDQKFKKLYEISANDLYQFVEWGRVEIVDEIWSGEDRRIINDPRPKDQASE